MHNHIFFKNFSKFTIAVICCTCLVSCSNTNYVSSKNTAATQAPSVSPVPGVTTDTPDTFSPATEYPILPDTVTEETSEPEYEPGSTLSNNSQKWVDFSIMINSDLSSSCIYSSDEIVNTLLKYESVINSAADEVSIPPEFIYSILSREMSQTNMTDLLADGLVLSYYDDMQSTGNSSKKEDSSTGLGQIFARTAIYSYNNLITNKVISGQKLDYDDWKQRKSVWNSLYSDNEYNIKFAGYTLKSICINKNIDSDKSMSDENIKSIFSAYNGSGEAARQYGECTFKFYDYLANH